MKKRRNAVGAAVVAGLLATPAVAQQQPVGRTQAPLPPAPSAPSTAQPAQQQKPPVPVLLEADQVDTDNELGITTASGHVQIFRDRQVLLADAVSYSAQHNVLTASGHVSLVDSDGSVTFADYMELTDDMKQGFMDQARKLLQDNSRVAGYQAERIDGRYTRVVHGTYSPCQLCAEDPSQDPTWQIQARQVTHDMLSHELYFRDATMQIDGVDVGYMPIFSMPDPTVERRSGFLTPSAGYRSDLGTFARIFYYWDIDDDKDLTTEITPSESDHLLVGGRYRQRFVNGNIDIAGSVTYSQNAQNVGSTNEVVYPYQVRGHVAAIGRFDIDDAWRWGFDINRTSDNNFLLRYNYSSEQLLTSRAYIERLSGRDYFNVGAYAFQDLIPGHTTQDPLALPLVTYSAMGEPGETWGGRWSFDANILNLFRDNGPDTRRASAVAGWQRDFISSWGLVSTVDTSLRTDGYYVTRINANTPDGSTSTGATTGGGVSNDPDLSLIRVFPQVQLTNSLPMRSQYGSVTAMIEPIVQFTAGTNYHNNSRLPNEDSQDIELDATNLFNASRYPGQDLLEGGQRVTYGAKAGLYGDGGGSSTVFFGQSYRFQHNGSFATNSGLYQRRSDYVGQVELTPNPWMDISYNFRLDSDTGAQRMHDIFGSFGPQIFRVNGGYIYIDKTEIANGSNYSNYNSTENLQEATMGFTSAFMDHWSAGASYRTNLAPDGGPISTSLVGTYQDDCLTFSLIAEHDYVQRTGLPSGNKIFFRVFFKTLGLFASPVVSGL